MLTHAVSSTPYMSLGGMALTDSTVKQVNYPKTSPTREWYEQCRNPNGGYGGLLSATFYNKQDAVAFFDNLDTVKGPSLGTNFTISSPYVILAHYGELDWVRIALYSWYTTPLTSSCSVQNGV